MPTPDISVVIPTHNSMDFLAETVDSILAQRDVNIEIIAADDGSQDGTLKFLQDRNIRTVDSPHVLQSRTLGVAAASAPVTAFLDHDDLWHPDKSRKQLHLLRQHPDLVAVGCGIRLFTRDPANSQPLDLVELDAKGIDRVARCQATAFNPCSIMIPTGIAREGLAAISGYEPEDMALFAWLARRGRVANLPEDLAYRRLSSGSQVSTTYKSWAPKRAYTVYAFRDSNRIDPISREDYFRHHFGWREKRDIAVDDDLRQATVHRQEGSPARAAARALRALIRNPRRTMRFMKPKPAKSGSR